MKSIELFTPENCKYATQADAKIGFKEFGFEDCEPTPCLVYLLNEDICSMTVLGWFVNTEKNTGNYLMAFGEDEELILLGFQTTDIRPLKEGDVCLTEIGDYFKVQKTESDGFCFMEMTALLDQKDAEKLAEIRGFENTHMELGSATCHDERFPIWFSKKENSDGVIAYPVFGEDSLTMQQYAPQDIAIKPFSESLERIMVNGRIFKIMKEPHLYLQRILLYNQNQQNLPS